MKKIKKSLNLASKIRLARKATGLSQKELANVLKVSDKAVSAYEVGRANPPVDTLKEISKVTSKPFSYFISDDEEEINEAELVGKISQIERDLQEVKELLKKRAK